MDRIFWNYLEELPEQEAAWSEWQSGLASWYRFNTFYTHYLRVENNRAKFLECTIPCEHGCPRQIEETSPYDIAAVCIQDKAEPIQLKFRDILIYSLRREALHQALCVSLQVERPSGNVWAEFGSTWYLGDYCDATSQTYCPVYITYRIATLTEDISSIYLSHQKPFILMVPTVKNVTPEIQQFMANNNSVLLSMEAELNMQPDGSFKPKRSISECMKSCNQP